MKRVYRSEMPDASCARPGCGKPLPKVRAKHRLLCDECAAPVGRAQRSKRVGARATTIAPKRLSKEEIRDGLLLEMPTVPRPLTRGECTDGERPCPWVSCKHHLYLDVNAETGSIKLNFPDIEPWEMKETCALDVADKGGVTLEEVGAILNLTRERIRQVEVRGLIKLKTEGDLDDDGSEPLVQLERAQHSQMQRVLAVLKSSPEHVYGAQDLVMKCQMSYHAALAALNKLFQCGVAERVAIGRYRYKPVEATT